MNFTGPWVPPRCSVSDVMAAWMTAPAPTARRGSAPSLRSPTQAQPRPRRRWRSAPARGDVDHAETDTGDDDWQHEIWEVGAIVPNTAIAALRSGPFGNVVAIGAIAVGATMAAATPFSSRAKTST